ncbi:MAG: putative ABC transporter permease [Frankia sp.]|nr:putative ABC transporter permease [Frankia sp.]
MTRAQRFLTYGLAGWCFEVAFTGVKAPARDKDWRLTSHTYLWMLPIYGSAAVLFEPAHDALRTRPWWQRGAAYAAGIYAVEAGSGAAISRLTGEVPWDYSRARGTRPVPRHWRGLVRPAYAPVWFLAGLGLERLHDALDRR